MSWRHRWYEVVRQDFDRWQRCGGPPSREAQNIVSREAERLRPELSDDPWPRSINSLRREAAYWVAWIPGLPRATRMGAIHDYVTALFPY